MSSVTVIVYETLFLEKALPRLVEKGLQTGKRMVIITGTQERAFFIDQLLWTYTPVSFLPHGCQGKDLAPQDHPIWITFQEETGNKDKEPLPPIVVLVETLDIPKELDGVEKILAFALPQERDKAQQAFQDFPHCSFWTQTDAGWKNSDKVESIT